MANWSSRGSIFVRSARDVVVIAHKAFAKADIAGSVPWPDLHADSAHRQVHDDGGEREPRQECHRERRLPPRRDADDQRALVGAIVRPRPRCGHLRRRDPVVAQDVARTHCSALTGPRRPSGALPPRS